MRMRDEVQRLRAEHAALICLSTGLLELAQAPEMPDPNALATARALLRDALLRHLKCEDWVLYPRLRASGEPHLADMALIFVDEMGHIAADFLAYDDKWTAAAVAADRRGFVAESKALLTVLATRIAREEAELYPAAEQLDGASSSDGIGTMAPL